MSDLNDLPRSGDVTDPTTCAWPAREIAAAEAPVTAGTDRYMRAAAHAVARAARVPGGVGRRDSGKGRQPEEGHRGRQSSRQPSRNAAVGGLPRPFRAGSVRRIGHGHTGPPWV